MGAGWSSTPSGEKRPLSRMPAEGLWLPVPCTVSESDRVVHRSPVSAASTSQAPPPSASCRPLRKESCVCPAPPPAPRPRVPLRLPQPSAACVVGPLFAGRSHGAAETPASPDRDAHWMPPWPPCRLAGTPAETPVPRAPSLGGGGAGSRRLGPPGPLGGAEPGEASPSGGPVSGLRSSFRP